MTKSSEAKSWTHRKITETKRSVKEELDRLGGSDPKARLEAALERVAATGEDQGSAGRLRRLIYVISALVQHERSGGLKPAEINHLVKLAHALLRTQGIRPGSSTLSFLYSDLHLALSQIYRKQGQIWKSAWEQQLATYLGKEARSESNSPAVDSVSMAIRALRLGHAHIAIAELAQADRSGLPDALRPRALLEWHKALRLSRRFDEARALAKETERAVAGRDEESLELRWETLCREAQATGKIDELVVSVLRGKPHNHSAYVFEAFLWTRAIQARQYLERFPRAKAMARNASLDPRSLGTLQEVVKALERCYDTDVPLLLRIEDLGSVISRMSALYTVDWELLAWAASARWLFRINSRPLGALALNEYRALSFRLTGQSCGDTLGLVSDLVDPYAPAEADRATA